MIHSIVNGNLGADPELKHLPDGTPVCRLRVASSHRAKVGGEWADATIWVSVDVFGKRGETLARLITKGSKVSVRGMLTIREFDKKDGSRGYSVDVRADEVELMGGGGGGRREEAHAPAAYSGDSVDIPF